VIGSGIEVIPIRPSWRPGLDAMADAARCGARTRSGAPCRGPAVGDRARCRMHGGSDGSGAPKGRGNGRYRSGYYTAARRRWRADLLHLSGIARRARTPPDLLQAAHGLVALAPGDYRPDFRAWVRYAQVVISLSKRLEPQVRSITP